MDVQSYGKQILSSSVEKKHTIKNIDDPIEEEALRIYKRVTSFDSTVDKALGKLSTSKRTRKLSKFGKLNKNYSFIREPTFDNLLLSLHKSGIFSIHDLQTLRSVHPLYDQLYKTFNCSIDIDFFVHFLISTLSWSHKFLFHF